MLPAASYTRVAVVQLAYHPAIVAGLRSPLEDPLFVAGQADSLLPPSRQVPPELKQELDALRKRIREAYDAQLLAKVRAVLDACRAWKVRLVVFPEYSLPWEILGGVADAAGDMVVVAGTHTVERAARRKGLYERLVAPTLPAVGQSVCPVLHQGRLLSLQPKLHPAIPERDSMKPGESWSPVAMPAGLPGPMGVLLCLDFLYRESELSREQVARQLGACRFLAVPSLTPHYTLNEFAAKAWEEARRYGRPVLYCDGAEGGGTSLYVDEGSPADLRQFPERSGYLEPGDEGVIVADVDLGYERPGPSTRYDAPRPLRPVAEATLVYQAQPAGQAYAGWLERASPLLARDDDAALEALVEHVEQGREVLLDAGALSGAKARDRRLRRLVDSLDKVTSLEELRRMTREVVLPADVLPLAALRGAMARGAADRVFDWLKRREAGAAGFAEVEERLRKAAEAGRDAHAWATGVMPVLGAVASAVRGAQEEPKPRAAPAPEVKVVLPSGIDPAALGVRTHAGWVLSFKARPGDFRAHRDEPHEKLRGRTRSPKPEMEGHAPGSHFTNARIEEAEELFSLALAEGAERAAVVGVWSQETPHVSALLIVFERDGQWTAWTDGHDGWLDSSRESIQGALRASGLENAALEVIPPDALGEHIRALLPRFTKGAPERVAALREKRLRDVQQKFIEPDVSVNGGERVPILTALDAWLGSKIQTALVLGEFGSGKSTSLTEWACIHWGHEDEIPRILLASLAGASTSQDAEALLLEASALEDVPAHRAALRVLVRRGLLLPCFDGFDEMATRIDASEFAGRLSDLLSVAGSSGKVLVSSRSHYFSHEAQLQSAVTEALARTLGQSASLQRIELQPLTEEQVERLVRKVLPERKQADQALDRIARTYDLQDLVHRPLLLGMVLKTLDQLAPGSKVGRADLYEAYLARWLEQTRSKDPDCFTDEQKISFAESLAEQLWRSGRPDCSWQELQHSVLARLIQHLPGSMRSMPVGAALLEIQGGAFFVHEGEDRYRFAHKSFLEYFLARALVHTLPERPLEALRTRPLTQEVAAFVGEILRREGEPRASKMVQKVQLFLTEGRTGPQPLGSTTEAAANAVRLLLGLSRWADDREGWFPERADLREVVLAKEDLRGARFVGANLAGADLSAADLSDADLSEACLDNARLPGTRLSSARLVRARARAVDFTLAEAEQALLDGVDLQEALLRQSTWMRCQWKEARLDGADLTAWVTPASTPVWPQTLSVVRCRLEASLATGHAGGVNSVAWDREGRRLAFAGSDGTVRLWEVKQRALLGTFLAAGRATLACSPRGFCVFGNEEPERIHLALRPPKAHAGTELYLPLAGLREIFHNPDKVAAALAGDPGEATVWGELEKRGLGEGTTWSGEMARMPPRASDTAPPPPAQKLPPNPFRPGPALTDAPILPGREAVLSDLEALIENRSPAVLRGPRRVGKTSILHMLARRLAQTHRVRHVSLEARRIVTDDDLARALEDSLAGKPAPASTLRTRLLEETASVLLIDEIANLREADASVFAWLRAVGQERTSIVLVGSHWDWVEVVRQAASAPGSSFGNDVTPVNLGPLSEADALDFLAKTAPPDVPLAREKTARWIVERCGTWPFYLQVMGYAVVQAVRTGSRQALVEPAGVTELYENRLLVDRDAGFFHTRWSELPARARSVLWRMRSSPDANLPAVKALSPEDRKILRDAGFCDPYGRWLDDKPFYDWIRRIADEELGRI